MFGATNKRLKGVPVSVARLGVFPPFWACQAKAFYKYLLPPQNGAK